MWIFIISYINFLFYFYYINETGIIFYRKKIELWQISWDELSEVGDYTSSCYKMSYPGAGRDPRYMYTSGIYLSKQVIPPNEKADFLQLAMLCSRERDHSYYFGNSMSERFRVLSGIVAKEALKKYAPDSGIWMLFQDKENRKLLLKTLSGYKKNRNKTNERRFYRILGQSEIMKDTVFLLKSYRLMKALQKYCPLPIQKQKSYYEINRYEKPIYKKFLAPFRIGYSFTKYEFSFQPNLIGRHHLWENFEEIGIFELREKKYIYLSTVALTSEQRQNPKKIKGVMTIKYSKEALDAIRKFYMGTIYE